MHLGALLRSRAVFWLLVGLTAATRLAVAFADHRSLAGTDVYSDDAFYYLRIAANVAQGRGFTFDGAAVTNGFHPLYLLSLLPIMKLAGGDPVLSIRLSAALLTVWAMATALLLHTLLVRLAGKSIALYGLLVWAICPYFVLMSVNGLETGVAMTFVVLVLLLYFVWFCGDATPSAPRALAFGAVCGLALLARIDLVLLLVALAIEGLVRHARRPRLWLGPAGLTLVATGIVWLSWGAVSHAATGHWLPLSGAASRNLALNFGWLTLEPIWTDLGSRTPVFDPQHVPGSYHADVFTKLMFVFLSENPLLVVLRANVAASSWANLDSYVPYRLFIASPRLWTAVLLSALSAAAVAARRRSHRRSVLGVDTPNPARTTLRRILAVHFGLTCLGYTLYSPAHWYFNRYLAGSILLVTIWALVEVDALLSRRTSLVMATSVVALAVVACQVTQWRFARTLRWSDAPASGFLAAWQSLEGRIPPHERVAAFQAGTYSYFSGRDVINLDGKVNQDAFVALRDKRLHEYIAANHVRYILDWPRMLWVLCERHAPPGALSIRSIAVDPNGSGVHLFEVGGQSPAE